MELTLLTINTWKCDGDYYIRRGLLGQRLKAEGARVILCQECFQTADGTVDTLAYLSERLELPAYFVPARRFRRKLAGEMVDSYSGLGILTALRVLDHRSIELPSSAEDGGRNAQLLMLEVLPGLSMLVANIHLTHLRDDRLRREQLHYILHEIQRSDAHLRLIGGDWNTPVGSPMLSEMMQTIPAADCYVLGGGTGTRVSLLAPFLREDRSICVDHFITLPVSGPGISYPSFVSAGVVLNEPDAKSGLYPSDHFGIRVTLTY